MQAASCVGYFNRAHYERLLYLVYRCRIYPHEGWSLYYIENLTAYIENLTAVAVELYQVHVFMVQHSNLNLYGTTAFSLYDVCEFHFFSPLNPLRTARRFLRANRQTNSLEPENWNNTFCSERYLEQENWNTPFCSER